MSIPFLHIFRIFAREIRDTRVGLKKKKKKGHVTVCTYIHMYVYVSALLPNQARWLAHMQRIWSTLPVAEKNKRSTAFKSQILFLDANGEASDRGSCGGV